MDQGNDGRRRASARSTESGDEIEVEEVNPEELDALELLTDIRDALNEQAERQEELNQIIDNRLKQIASILLRVGEAIGMQQQNGLLDTIAKSLIMGSKRK